MGFAPTNQEAQEARFKVFVRTTTRDERDWISFLELEQAIHRVADRAAIVNPFDDPNHNVREIEELEGPVGEMLFAGLKRLSLGMILANAEGIGHALRFGLIEAKRDGLAGIADDDALETLARRGDDALRADMKAVEDRVFAERTRRARKTRARQPKA
jgi:hypothetical protein